MRVRAVTNVASAARNKDDAMMRRRNALEDSDGRDSNRRDAIATPEPIRLEQDPIGRAHRPANSVDNQLDSPGFGGERQAEGPPAETAEDIEIPSFLRND